MVLIPPRPFLLGRAFIPLVNAVEYFMQAIPYGASWRFMFLLVDYPVLVEDTTQLTPHLRFRGYDADGRSFHVEPVFFRMVTTPSGAGFLDATNSIGIDYPGGSSIKIEITGQIPGTGPATVSLTPYGLRGWEGYGA
jgi:hypothetical protein